MFLVGNGIVIITGGIIFILFITIVVLVFGVKRIIKEKDNLETNLKTQNKDSENYISNHDKYVSDSEKEIKELKEKITEKNRIINCKKSTISRRNKRIKNLLLKLKKARGVK